ncbi:hypothetical protein JRF84_34670, partial [Methylobacterium organophilum]|uniref:hypothetical protein n=1 Tax=Methylobacterium organophilum TaxID=410 RepID=UPI0019D122BC
GRVGRLRPAGLGAGTAVRLGAVLWLAVLWLAVLGLRVEALGRPTGCAGGRVRRLGPLAGRTRTARTLARSTAIRHGSVGSRVALRGTVRLVIRAGAVPVRCLALLRRRRTLGRRASLGRRGLIAIRSLLALGRGPSGGRPLLRPAIRTIRLLIPPLLLPLLLSIRMAVRPIRRRRTGRRRLRPALGRALPLGRFGLRLALGGRLGT